MDNKLEQALLKLNRANRTVRYWRMVWERTANGQSYCGLYQSAAAHNLKQAQKDKQTAQATALKIALSGSREVKKECASRA